MKPSLFRFFLGRDFGFGPLNEESAEFYASWRPASGHPGGWRVVRGMSPLEEHEGKSGRLITFKSIEAAQKRADLLNANDLTP